MIVTLTVKVTRKLAGALLCPVDGEKWRRLKVTFDHIAGGGVV
jgi:hypothetical protein